ncbi:MAG: hypothetical protein Q8P59_10710, partial [Dehalococcoidia bacterium]|nr:hypothetical protein [Dehalococcoidia bacterium]
KIAYATDPIVLDSNFDDWAGEMCQSDGSGDAAANGDIVNFCWADNAGDSATYFMIERVSGNGDGSVTYRVYIDTNNNGNYSEDVDRYIEVAYTARKNNSTVNDRVFTASGSQVESYTNQDWGSSTSEGSTKVEFKASFSALGISAGQTIRMYAQSTTEGDRAPDSGDIQWSPVDILGYPLLGAAVIIVALLIWRCEGRLQWKRNYSR